MEVGEAILALGAGERPASFDQFSAAIDPQWIADTLENVAYFGRPPSRHGEGAGYPQLRLVTLLALRAHLLAAAAFGPYRTSELALATPVWATLPEHALVILDRGFCCYALFHTLASPDRDRHWVVRARSGPTALTQAVVQRFGPGDALVELRPSPATCAKHPDLPPTLRVRAVRVQCRGFRPYWVFTSLRNPATHPAADLAALYHERWELELAFDELKTHTCERVEALRSKAPARVEHEVWGPLLAYNLVRLVMSRAAPRARARPVLLSYRYALLAVRAGDGERGGVGAPTEREGRDHERSRGEGERALERPVARDAPAHVADADDGGERVGDGKRVDGDQRRQLWHAEDGQQHGDRVG